MPAPGSPGEADWYAYAAVKYNAYAAMQKHGRGLHREELIGERKMAGLPAGGSGS